MQDEKKTKAQLIAELNELRESEKRFREFAENVREAFWMSEVSSGNITYVNPAYETIWGRSREEPFETLEAFMATICPEFREEVAASFERQLRGEHTELEYRIERPDGSIRWVRDRSLPIRNEAGEVYRFAGIAEDITERKRAEEELRESEAKYRLLADNVTDIIWTRDMNLNATYLSPSVERVTGFSVDEALTMANSERMTPASARLAMESLAEELAKEGQDGADPSRTRILQLEMLCKDGSTVWVETTMSFIRDGSGRALGVLGISRDITERKWAEEALRESEAKYRLLADNATDLITVTDLGGTTTYVSPSVYEIRGYTVEEALHQPLAERMTPASADLARSTMAKEFGDATQPRSGRGHVVTLELEAYCKDGSTTWIETQTSLMVDSNSIPIGFLAVSRDITENRRAEEERRSLEAQMQQAQKLESLGVMAGGIAHDFNNLLMIILGNADIAMMEMSTGALGRDRVAEIEKAARRAADLTNQMLAYSGHGAFDVGLIDLSALVEDMAHLLEVSHAKKAILNYEFAPHLPAIKADASQLRQVVMNLITNASEAIGEEGGFIRVSTDLIEADRPQLTSAYIDDDLPAGPYVRLEVTDTGHGMDDDTLARIFDPFFTTKFTGRGLGLAAVLGIVRGHHGALKVESQAGQGTTFRVLFPASPDQPAESAAKVKAPEAPQETGTILLVDDEDMVLELVSEMLEHSGFTVLTACDGVEAVEVFKEHSNEIDCVILDLTMPRMDGEEALEELRRIRSDVRVLLSSGYSKRDLEKRFAGRGLAGLIQKPYQRKDLIAKLKQALEA